MQYFPGQNAPGSRQPFALARCLADRGHWVTVVSGDLNLDTSEREERLRQTTRTGGTLEIVRLPCRQGGRGKNVARLRSYLSFSQVATRQGLRLRRPDVIIGSIQPLFTGLAAFIVARVKRVPFVLEIRDLWPDALVVKKAISRAQAFPLFGLANLLYRSADRIVSITPGIKLELVRKGMPEGAIDVFPNGFDPEVFKGSAERRGEARERYGWENDFVATYVGSFTKVTAVDVLVRAAACLQASGGIRFEFFGDGPTKGETVALAGALQARNVHFHEPVPKIEIPLILSGADVGLMSLLDTPLAHIYFENKFLDYMGAGKPIVAAMKGQQADIIRRHQIGAVVEPGDHAGLADTVRRCSLQPVQMREMGERASQLARQSYLLPDILERYAEVVESAAGRRLHLTPAWEPAS